MSAQAIPQGFHTLTPYLMTKSAKKVMNFLSSAFGAEEMTCTQLPDGKIMHAQFKIGDSMLMLSDATARHPAMPAMLYLYVANVDAVYEKALAAGGTSIREPTNEFYGDRSGGVLDMAGNQWWIATHVEDVPPEEMKRREQDWLKKNK